jgi:hypothetical protein
MDLVRGAGQTTAKRKAPAEPPGGKPALMDMRGRSRLSPGWSVNGRIAQSSPPQRGAGTAQIDPRQRAAGRPLPVTTERPARVGLAILERVGVGDARGARRRGHGRQGLRLDLGQPAAGRAFGGYAGALFRIRVPRGRVRHG